MTKKRTVLTNPCLLVGSILAILGMGTLAGCWGSGGTRVPLQGRVTVDGTPLTGTILLKPLAEGKGHPVSLGVDHGEFSVTAKRGPISGAHRAILTTRSDADAQPGTTRVTTECEIVIPSKAPYEVDIAFTSHREESPAKADVSENSDSGE